MDQVKLKKYALLLESEIEKYKDESKDVLALSEYEPIVKAIKDAKNMAIEQPHEIQLRFFYFESSIQNFRALSDYLAIFSLLLKGWEINDI